MNNIFRKTFLLALCFFCFAFPVFAQGDVTFVGDDDIGLDVSFQFGAVRAKTGVYDGVTVVGGRVGYYLGSIVFLDGAVYHKFNGGLTEPYNNEKMAVLGGVRLGTIFDDWIGVFAKARAGTFGVNTENSDMESAKSLYPVFDIGVIVERYFERNIFVRMEIGDWIIPFGDAKIRSVYGDYSRLGTTHNFAMEFGLGFRF